MPILGPALLTMVAAQLLDLATFVTMVGRAGITSEANPVVVNLFREGGMPVLVLAKLVLMVLIGALTVALLAMQGRGSRRAGWALLACAIVGGLVGGWSNAITMGPL